MSEINPKLNELVNSLSVLYQPVYGHHEWDNKAQRSCEDRLPDIKKIYDGLSENLHRPLRVLDLGCNMAYLSLTICSWGGGINFPRFIKKISGTRRIFGRRASRL